jgi:Region found in RelA / SpoT proteins
VEEISSHELKCSRGSIFEENAMAWTTPQYTKSTVGKAGERLIAPKTPEEYSDSLKVLSNWRSAHAYPLNSMQMSLRYQARKINKTAIISQRLKRIESIKGKLLRSKGMQLHRMQDIGGCRAILSSIEEVHTLRDRMKIRFTNSGELCKEFDYIENPKSSGYRGIHLIYKYRKENNLYNGLLIEVQLRSTIQHAWSTSVEIAGAFLGVPLKSGEGPSEWLTFFKLASILFSLLETPSDMDAAHFDAVRRDARGLSEKLSIIEQLKAFSVMTREADNIQTGQGYFLLSLRIDEKLIDIVHYDNGYSMQAAEDYMILEEKYKNENINVVLVAAESITALRQSYPNYFADSGTFIRVLEQVLA